MFAQSTGSSTHACTVKFEREEDAEACLKQRELPCEGILLKFEKNVRETKHEGKELFLRKIPSSSDKKQMEATITVMACVSSRKSWRSSESWLAPSKLSIKRKVEGASEPLSLPTKILLLSTELGKISTEPSWATICLTWTSSNPERIETRFRRYTLATSIRQSFWIRFWRDSAHTARSKTTPYTGVRPAEGTRSRKGLSLSKTSKQ